MGYIFVHMERHKHTAPLVNLNARVATGPLLTYLQQTGTQNSTVRTAIKGHEPKSRSFVQGHIHLRATVVHPILTLLLSTSLKNTRNSATKFAATTQFLNDLYKNMDSEMRKCFVGPMPFRDFLENLLPVQLPPARLGQLPGFVVMTWLVLESQMCNAFVRTFHDRADSMSDCGIRRLGLQMRSATASERSTRPVIPPAKRTRNTDRKAPSTTQK